MDQHNIFARPNTMNNRRAEEAAGAGPPDEDMNPLMRDDYDEYAQAPPVPLLRPVKEKKEEVERGIPLAKENEFLKQVNRSIKSMIENDKEAEIRGTNQRGMKYDNTCVLFAFLALESYLHVKFNMRFALRNFQNGIKNNILVQILERANLNYRSTYDNGTPIQKQHVRRVLEKASAELTSGIILVQYGEDSSRGHALAFYPVIIDENTTGVRVIDCRGDRSETLLDDYVHVVAIIECLDSPRVVPKQLRGGQKKTRRNRSSKKKTRGRRNNLIRIV